MANSETVPVILARLQAHVPFLKDMIGSLKVDMPQHAKIVALHAMITDKKRKFKIETLKKCEEVILKMQTKTYNKKKAEELPFAAVMLQKEVIISEPIRHPSPEKEPVPTIRSPDPETWNPMSLDRLNLVSKADRYTHEKPSVYTSAAESIGRPVNIFESISAIIPDISKPPISMEDLELLQDETECESEATTFKPLSTSPRTDKVPSKVSLVPAPLIKPKCIRADVLIDKKAESDRKEKARIEKIIKDTDSIFGNLLSSIDQQIIIKKRRDSRDGTKRDDDKRKSDVKKDPRKSDSKTGSVEKSNKHEGREKAERRKIEISCKQDPREKSEGRKSEISYKHDLREKLDGRKLDIPNKQDLREKLEARKNDIPNKQEVRKSDVAILKPEVRRTCVPIVKPVARNCEIVIAKPEVRKNEVKPQSSELFDVRNIDIAASTPIKPVLMFNHIIEKPKISTPIIAKICSLPALKPDARKEDKIMTVDLSADDKTDAEESKTEDSKPSEKVYKRLADKYNPKPRRQSDQTEPPNINVIDLILKEMNKSEDAKIPFILSPVEKPAEKTPNVDPRLQPKSINFNTVPAPSESPEENRYSPVWEPPFTPSPPYESPNFNFVQNMNQPPPPGFTEPRGFCPPANQMNAKPFAINPSQHQRPINPNQQLPMNSIHPMNQNLQRPIIPNQQQRPMIHNQQRAINQNQQRLMNPNQQHLMNQNQHRAMNHSQQQQRHMNPMMQQNQMRPMQRPQIHYNQMNTPARPFTPFEPLNSEYDLSVVAPIDFYQPGSKTPKNYGGQNMFQKGPQFDSNFDRNQYEKNQFERNQYDRFRSNFDSHSTYKSWREERISRDPRLSRRDEGFQRAKSRDRAENCDGMELTEAAQSVARECGRSVTRECANSVSRERDKSVSREDREDNNEEENDRPQERSKSVSRDRGKSASREEPLSRSRNYDSYKNRRKSPDRDYNRTSKRDRSSRRSKYDDMYSKKYSNQSHDEESFSSPLESLYPSKKSDSLKASLQNFKIPKKVKIAEVQMEEVCDTETNAKAHKKVTDEPKVEVKKADSTEIKKVIDVRTSEDDNNASEDTDKGEDVDKENSIINEEIAKKVDTIEEDTAVDVSTTNIDDLDENDSDGNEEANEEQSKVVDSTSMTASVVEEKPQEPETSDPKKESTDEASKPDKDQLLEMLVKFKESADVNNPIMGMFGVIVDYLKTAEKVEVKPKDEKVEVKPKDVPEPLKTEEKSSTGPEPKTDDNTDDEVASETNDTDSNEEMPVEPVVQKAAKKFVKKKNVIKKVLQKRKVAAKSAVEEKPLETVGERIKNRKRNPPVVRKPRKNELDKLHDDIKETLGDGLLMSNKRSCTIQKEVHSEQDELTTEILLEKTKDLRVVLQKLPEKLPKLKRKLEAPVTDTAPLPKRKSMTRAAKMIATTFSNAEEAYLEPANDSEADVDVEGDSTEKPAEELPLTKELRDVGKVVKRRRKSNAWATGVIKKKKKVSSKKGDESEADEVESLQEEDTLNKSTASDEPGLINDPGDNKKSVTEDTGYIEPDKEYYVKKGEGISCKLCSFSGKWIIHHYIMKHPKIDCPVARMSPEETAMALKDAKDAKLDALVEEKLDGKSCFNYTCRFCLADMKSVRPIVFYDHVTGHTGEFRYKCYFCPYKNNTKKKLRMHMTQAHEAVAKSTPIFAEFEPPNYRTLCAYVCSECNFMQLNKLLVEEHIQIYHLDDTAYPRKINMSIDPKPLDPPSVVKKAPKEGTKKKLEEVNKEIKKDDEVDDVGEDTSVREDASVVAPKVDKVDDDNASNETEGNESVPEVVEDVVKDPDMTAFMCDTVVLEEETNLKEIRLEKMKEIQDSIQSTKRTSFVNKLKDRLETASVEPAQVTEVVPEIPPETVTKEVVNIPVEAPATSTVVQVTTSPISTKSPVSTNDPMIPSIVEVKSPKKTAEVAKSPKKTVDRKQLTLQIPPADDTPRKTNTVGGIVDRLQNKLNTALLPKLSKVVKTPTEVEENVESLISVSVVDALLTKAKGPVFVCRKPSCIFRTPLRKVFEAHCTLTHKSEESRLTCYVCDYNKVMPMNEIFQHLCEHVDEKLTGITLPKRASEKVDSDADASDDVEIIERPTESIVITDDEDVPEPMFSFKITNVTSLAHVTDETSPAAVVPLKELPPLIPISVPDNPPKTFKFVVVSKSHMPQTVLNHTQPQQSLLINSKNRMLRQVQQPPTTMLLKVTPPKQQAAVKCKVVSMSQNEKNLQRKYCKIMEKWLMPEFIGVFFKCPEFFCGFATEQEDLFDKHMLTHSTSIFLPCLYCNFKMKAEFVKVHLMMRHAKCTYGCPYCFYRAISADYIQIHQEIEHAMLPIKSITFTNCIQVSKYKSPPLPNIKSLMEPYPCKCGRSFYVRANYEEHLDKCMPPGKFICAICLIVLPKTSALVMHYAKHQIFEYTCRYCSRSDNGTDDILKHIATEHPYQVVNIISRQLKDHSTRDIENDAMFNNLFILTNSEYVEPPIVASEALSIEPAAVPLVASVGPLAPVPSLAPVAPVALVAPEAPPVGSNSPEAIAEFDESMEMADDYNLEGEAAKKTGLFGPDLFRCAACSGSFADSQVMKAHLFKCVVTTNKPRPFVCCHCSKTFKSVANLIDHIRIHGTDRIGCSLCSYKHSHPWHLRAHLKVKHKINNCSIVPTDPNKKNIDFDEFLAKPAFQRRSSTVTDQTLASRSEAATPAGTQTRRKVSFGPKDVDQLPMSAIYNYDVFCSICKYTTKVRMNLVRHMGMHEKNTEAIIPVTAPINPVPCLEKNELMFDKMTNLASSSHAGGRMGVKPSARDESVVVPAFVPITKRYVCGANNCNYLCLEESMLKHHLQALHGHEQTYTCVHCQNDLSVEKANLDVDGILKHLRFHDSTLYRCPGCRFWHYSRNKVEKHCAERHPEAGLRAVTLREDLQPPVDPEVKDKEKRNRPWKCGMCKGHFSTKAEVKAHAENKHRIDTQYKCSYCDFKGLDRDTFGGHFEEHHKEYPSDIIVVYYNDQENAKAEAEQHLEDFDTTPLWVKNKNKIKHIRGILLEEQEKGVKKSPVKPSAVPVVERRPSIHKRVSNLDLAIEAVANGTDNVIKKVERRGRKSEADKLDLEKLTPPPGKRQALNPPPPPIEFIAVPQLAPLRKLAPKPEVAPLRKLAPEPEPARKAAPKPPPKPEPKAVPGPPPKPASRAVPVPPLKPTPILPPCQDVLPVIIKTELPDDPDEDPMLALLDAETAGPHNCCDPDIHELYSMPVERLLEGTFMGTYGPYGRPHKKRFVCPLCAVYNHEDVKQFEIHLCEELQYSRFGCNKCSFRSTALSRVHKHLTWHKAADQALATNLSPNRQIENWIGKVRVYQELLIKHHLQQTDPDAKPADDKSSLNALKKIVPTPKEPDHSEPNQGTSEAGKGASAQAEPQSMGDEAGGADIEKDMVEVLKNLKMLSGRGFLSGTGNDESLAGSGEANFRPVHMIKLGSTNYRCGYCTYSCRRRVVVVKHLTTVHRQRSVLLLKVMDMTKIVRSPRSSVSTFRCSRCPLTTDVLFDLKTHMEKYGSNTMCAYVEHVKRVLVANKQTARKSTGGAPQPASYADELVSHYGKGPDLTEEESKGIHTTLHIMNNFVTMNVAQLSKFVNIFPRVSVADCVKGSP